MVTQAKVLNGNTMGRILGITRAVPIKSCEMARSLRVAFFPTSLTNKKLSQFVTDLKNALLNAGVKVLSYEEALTEGTKNRIGKGIVLIAPGEGESGNLAIDHVCSLTHNTVVAVLDGTSPDFERSSLQKRVDTLACALVWHMAHLVIYVDDLSWTTCTMNGAIETFGLESLRDRVLDSLVPKLAAPVIPPQKEDFDICENAFDPSDPKYKLNLHELLKGAETWGRMGLLASRTKLETLNFRNAKYRRIVSAYLNQRTGMSYGFLARQLPMPVRAAVRLEEAHSMLRQLDWEEKDFIEIDSNMIVALNLRNQRFVVTIPEISVLCTRSGCEKLKPDPAGDFVILTFTKGRVRLSTPKDVMHGSDCQPSFDTLTIVSHAVGNAIVASVLCRLRRNSSFVRSLTHTGLAIAHWHGYLSNYRLPTGYFLHGQKNPPVCCSTAQAAIFSMSGKLDALASAIELGIDYLGDAHVEPSHGTNLNGRSLTELARIVCEDTGEYPYSESVQQI